MSVLQEKAPEIGNTDDKVNDLACDSGLLSKGLPLFEKYAEKNDCDLIFYNGPVTLSPSQMTPLLNRRVRRKNAMLILVTNGGDPNVAYRFGRMLQHLYGQYTMMVSGFCKSAGTLLALGANELVFCDFGELGPLDVQMIRQDDFFAYESGLTLISALKNIEAQAMETFIKVGRELLVKSNGVISLKTAGSMAIELTTGLYKPIYEQINPMHLGKTDRAIKIAEHFGRRLAEHADNIQPGALQCLISDYPSHNFVIDQQEAERLFYRIRNPEAFELLLLKHLKELAVIPLETTTNVIYLNPDNRNSEGSLSLSEVTKTPVAMVSLEINPETNGIGI